MRTVAVPLAALLLAGCGALKSAGDKSKAENALKALSIDYLKYQTANQGRPARDATELETYLRDSPFDATLTPGELQLLTVQWGAKLEPQGADAGNRVLASGPKVGGEVSVLMQDGSVRWMAEAALASAQKAEPAKRP